MRQRVLKMVHVEANLLDHSNSSISIQCQHSFVETAFGFASSNIGSCHC
jgi:hypothetical protein